MLPFNSANPIFFNIFIEKHIFHKKFTKKIETVIIKMDISFVTRQ